MYKSYKENIIEESSTLHKALFGFRIHPHQNLEVTLKKHEYLGLLNFIRKLNDEDDLRYMRSDAYNGIRTINKIRDKIDMGIAPPKYKNITVNDCDLTIDWFKNVCIKEINARLKEI